MVSFVAQCETAVAQCETAIAQCGTAIAHRATESFLKGRNFYDLGVLTFSTRFNNFSIEGKCNFCHVLKPSIQ